MFSYTDVPSSIELNLFQLKVLNYKFSIYCDASRPNAVSE